LPVFFVYEGKEACAEFLRGMLAWMIEALDRHIAYVSAEVCVLGDHAFDRGTFAFTETPKSGGDTFRSVSACRYIGNTI
jgi:hypothetical protein